MMIGQQRSPRPGAAPKPQAGQSSADKYPELASAFGQQNGVNFLYPTTLRVTTSALRRVAIIGSCFMKSFRYERSNPSNCPVDLYVVNNASQLPSWPGTDQEPDPYDFLIVQIGLRFVAPDLIWRLPYADPSAFEREFAASVKRMTFQLKSRMEWNHAYGLLTFVTNFTVPQRNPMGSLFPRYDLRNPEFYVERLNQALEMQVRESRNAYILDLDRLSTSFGRRYNQDDTTAPMSHGMLTGFPSEIGGRIEPIPPMIHHYEITWHREFAVSVWNEALGMFRTVQGVDAVKMVVVDLDDTLWTGVVGEMDEPGPEIIAGWQAGLLEALRYLKQRGILLGILSKNEDSRIRALWPRIFGQKMSLDDFAVARINWLPKPENMRTALNAVNLLPRSVVFIDDNPAERDAMQRAFPDMRILGRHPYYLRHILLYAAETQTSGLTDEGARRTEMVQAQLRREDDRASISEDDFLRAASPIVTCTYVRDLSGAGFSRAAELVGKTNQFNTTGLRWNSSDWQRLIAEGGALLIFAVQDSYTDYGMVGVVILRDAMIEQFVMSCRVLGYGIERVVLAHLVARMRAEGATTIRARLILTDANFPCRSLFSDAGFVEASDAWTLPEGVRPPMPDHVRVS